MPNRMLSRRIANLLLMLAVMLGLLVGCTISPTVTGNTTTSGTVQSQNEIIRVHMIDVGHADGLLIQTEEGNMLIDTGNYAYEDQGKITSYLDQRGVTDIDWMVLTHPHGDHIGGASTILSRYDVKRVMLPDATYDTYAYEKLLRDIIASDAEIHLVDFNDTRAVSQLADVVDKVYFAGEAFTWGKLTFTVINPVAGDGNVNNLSVVLRMVYGNNAFLFTGDMETVAELKALQAYKGDLQCDVLKVGHHGSYTSTGKALLDRVKPKYALISCAEGNEYGHPHLAPVNRLKAIGATIYRTDLNGSITALSDGNTISIFTAK